MSAILNGFLFGMGVWLAFMVIARVIAWLSPKPVIGDIEIKLNAQLARAMRRKYGCP